MGQMRGLAVILDLVILRGCLNGPLVGFELGLVLVDGVLRSFDAVFVLCLFRVGQLALRVGDRSLGRVDLLV